MSEQLCLVKVHVGQNEWGTRAIKPGDRPMGNYEVAALIPCPFCSEVRKINAPTLSLIAVSHDEEPYVSFLSFECFVCAVRGNAVPAHGCGIEVGDTGIATPTEWDLIANPNPPVKCKPDTK